MARSPLALMLMTLITFVLSGLYARAWFFFVALTAEYSVVTDKIVVNRGEKGKFSVSIKQFTKE